MSQESIESDDVEDEVVVGDDDDGDDVEPKADEGKALPFIDNIDGGGGGRG